MDRKAKAIVLLVSGLMLVISAVATPVGFDVRQHLSTTSRYGAGKALAGIVEDVPPVPSGCEPIHLNLVIAEAFTEGSTRSDVVTTLHWTDPFSPHHSNRLKDNGVQDVVNDDNAQARHGTRTPTKKRIKELDVLASRLAKQIEVDPEENVKRPAWLLGFQSPWKGQNIGGQLIPEGEEDMYHLGQRIRERFPQLFKYDYHPEIYPITATQVPRSAASAVAFGMGLFGGTGSLGETKQRAFSVITDSRKDDIRLRFHESCMKYKESKRLRKPAVQDWQDEIYRDVGASVSTRHALNLTTDDAASLWLLCKQEAAILDITDRACGLFNSAEVELLEWADDLQAHHLKGYGEAINYRMGVPLLQDVVTTMERAVSASEGLESDGAVEVAKLRVAHAETVIPFTCLLGLFLEGPDVRSLQSEQPLKYALRPPHQRTWKGSLVAPFGANTQLVLYKCPKDSKQTGDKSNVDSKVFEYLVQVLHNEKPVTMPACGGAHLCPFTEFKETVAGPHLKYSFEKLCTVEAEPIPPKQSRSWAQGFLGVIRSMFHWPCQQSPDLGSTQSQSYKDL